MYTPGFRDSGTGPTQPAAASIPESFMDIVNYVDANYRTLKDRAHRAVCGLSMGGGHTFHVSLLESPCNRLHGGDTLFLGVEDENVREKALLLHLETKKPKRV